MKQLDELDRVRGAPFCSLLFCPFQRCVWPFASYDNERESWRIRVEINKHLVFFLLSSSLAGRCANIFSVSHLARSLLVDQVKSVPWAHNQNKTQPSQRWQGNDLRAKPEQSRETKSCAHSTSIRKRELCSNKTSERAALFGE